MHVGTYNIIYRMDDAIGHWNALLDASKQNSFPIHSQKEQSICLAMDETTRGIGKHENGSVKFNFNYKLSG